MSINVGVIGVGYLGRHHARIYSDLEGVSLKGVADTDLERAEEIAGQYGAKAFENYGDMLDHVDAVSIVTPTVTHYDIALECIRAGKDVLVEKPITKSVDEADSLIREADKRGRLIQVGHLERFNPAVVALEGLLEKPRFIESERLSTLQGRGLDVDVTLDLMIHDVDIVTSLLGGAHLKDIKVVGAKVLTDKLDVAKAWLEFEGGTSALITASRISRAKQRTLKLYQENSYVILDYQTLKIVKHHMSSGKMLVDTIEVEQKEPLREELLDYIECIRTRRRPRVSGEDGRDALEIVLKINEKIRNASN